MSYRLEFTIKGVPGNPNNGYKSWRGIQAERRKWRRLVCEHVDGRARPKEPLGRAQITCIRATHRKDDFDNRVASFKSVIDGLVDAQVIKSDSDDVIIVRQYLHELTGPKNCHIRVIVEAIK